MRPRSSACDDASSVACVPPSCVQLIEHAKQVERFGRGVHGRQNLPGQMIFDGADQRGRFSGGAQNRVDQ